MSLAGCKCIAAVAGSESALPPQDGVNMGKINRSVWGARIGAEMYLGRDEKDNERRRRRTEKENEA